MNLSPHFTLAEAEHSVTASRLGIDNSAPQAIIPALKFTANKLELVRTLLNAPISVSSWYRSLELNRALKSKDSSKHRLGEAVDFISPACGAPERICRMLLKYKSVICWDQLILEHTWIHISWNSIPSGNQRGQVLSLLKNGSYASGLTDADGKTL